MSGSNTKIEWYLARDGQQHGPLSEPELRKFIELGHLHPTDLVWRAGFPEWRTASEVFPETEPASAAPPPPPPNVDETAATSTAAGIETIAPAEPASSDQLASHADPQLSQSSPQSGPEQPVADATRHDSPTQRDTGGRDSAPSPIAADSNKPAGPGRNEPSTQPPQTGAQGANPAAGRQRPSDRAGPADRAQPAPGNAPGPGQPQFQQPDPRLGGTGQPAQPGGSPHQSRDARRQSYGPTAGQHPNTMQQPNVRQAPAAGTTRHPGPGPNAGPGQPNPQRGPNPQGPYGAANPNMYGNPAADVYPGGGQQHHPGFQQNPAQQQQQQRASLDDEDDFYDDDDFDQQPRRRPIVAAVVSLVLLAMIGAGGWFAYTNQAALMEVFNELTKEATGQPEVVSAPETPARVAADSARQPSNVKTASTSAAQQPPAAAAPTAVASYSELPIFKTQFWQSFNSLYPAWAKAQESNAGKLQANGKSSDEVLAGVVKSLVEWRRSNADKILAASPDHLRTLAKTFVANLQFLVTQDVQACYGYISKGELSPTVLPLFGNPDYVGQLGTQTEATIAAAQNGTSTKKTYKEPVNEDFTFLANLLVKRGWTESDLKMFSDPTELSTAPASKVCTLVTQWFQTQLEMPPSDKQMRLLATSLQPVVRG
ncbi:MAG: GYF domain-containing protein [Pseudomonadota bacterium]